MTIFILILAVILMTVGIVYLIDKYVPKKYKPFILVGLWTLIIYLGYITFMSIYGEIQFNQLKEKRYKVVIENLKDIRDSCLGDVFVLIGDPISMSSPLRAASLVLCVPPQSEITTPSKFQSVLRILFKRSSWWLQCCPLN